MSSIKLVHSGGNSVSITAPDSNPGSNRTLKLPDVNGTLATTNGVSMIDMWRLNLNYNIPHNSTAVISTAQWERPDKTNDAFGQLGTGMSVNAGAHADGVWTFPSTGFYMITCGAEVFSSSANGTEVSVRMEATEDGASFSLQSLFRVSGPQNYWRSGYGNVIMDVTNTSNVKFGYRYLCMVTTFKTDILSNCFKWQCFHFKGFEHKVRFRTMK